VLCWLVGVLSFEICLNFCSPSFMELNFETKLKRTTQFVQTNCPVRFCYSAPIFGIRIPQFVQTNSQVRTNELPSSYKRPPPFCPKPSPFFSPFLSLAQTQRIYNNIILIYYIIIVIEIIYENKMVLCLVGWCE